ncbi:MULTISPECIES: flagellar motor switch protein FliN [unclassified Pseudacidovorax]|uniref:flagellar motor switch protein FliN n=1 Tax=unclassified Pseudacidovorax TaxID=2620592 RepID=UPI0025EC0747|nr:flagellar motor switch protein FliN [Pseudacidovorax sp.]
MRCASSSTSAAKEPSMSNDTSSSSAAWAEPLEPGEPGAAAATPDAAAMAQDIQRVLDIPVQLSVELGRKKVPIKQVLQMGQGTIVELDTLAGEPMDVLVNGYLVAQGEVVVVNNRFGIRLTDVVTPSERLRRVHRA